MPIHGNRDFHCFSDTGVTKNVNDAVLNKKICNPHGEAADLDTRMNKTDTLRHVYGTLTDLAKKAWKIRRSSVSSGCHASAVIFCHRTPVG